MSLNNTGFRAVKSQEGAALFVSLILLVILTIVGLSAAQRSNLQEKMAANTHLQNMVFNSAESAIGGFLVEANVGNKLDPAHILSILRINGSIADQCYDENGLRSDCTTAPRLDGDRAGVIRSEMDVAVVDACNPTLCGGFSLGGSGGGIGCRIFQVDGTGQAGTAAVTNTLWAYEITVCSK